MIPHADRLEPEMLEGVTALAEFFDGKPINALEVAEVRAQFEVLAMGNIAPRTDVGAVHDLEIDGPAGPLPARLYLPPDVQGPHPVLTWFHGGGWVLGSIEGDDRTVRRLCKASGAAVLSVDYRLAPEHPFPAAVEDAISAIRFTQEHGAAHGLDTARVAVGGGSAGGNLAAVGAIAHREDQLPPLVAQLLVYPVTDWDLTRPSYIEFHQGPLLEHEDMKWFWNHYCPAESDRRSWRASPLQMNDLSGIAPAVVMLAHLDPLYSEGVAYVEAMRSSGVEVDVVDMEDLCHGAISFADSCGAAQDAIEVAGEHLARLLGTTPTRS